MAKDAIEADVHVIGISSLAAGHQTLVPQLMEKLKAASLNDVGVLVGGIIPEADVPALTALGVARVFGPGTTLPEIVEFIQSRRGAAHA